MKFIFTLLISLVVVSSSYSQYSNPESVTYDPIGKNYYISNTLSQKIVKRDQQGVVTDFATVGSSIYGVTYYNGNIYVANGNRIRGYSIATGMQIFLDTVTGASFLNGIAIDSTTGILYASNFASGVNARIYKVNLNNGESNAWANLPRQPNGVYVDKARNRVLVCSWGASAVIMGVSLNDSSTVNTLITTPYTNLDGIKLDRNDHVYISVYSSTGSVARYDINFTFSPVIVASGFSNPADIYVNRWTDTLVVPSANTNTVLFFPLSIPTNISSNNGFVNSFKLNQNFPNPFNPETNISFSLYSKGLVNLSVYDVSGKIISTILNKDLTEGNYEFNFKSGNLPSGVYYYKLTAGDFSEVKSMMLIK
ncbi:MAG TPA: T9SS type A sorting domain-containing protein [Ignavibacteria bacterium]|nr:T9SS type A sorting domain-containing protein [Ignavibacteria bacterium]